MNDKLNPLKIEQILQKRAAKYAQSNATRSDEKIIAEITVVAVGAEKLGLPVEQLSVIIQMPDIARLPKMPAIIEGLVQYRGDIFTVVNIARWFSVAGESSGKLMAVLETANGKLGIRIDAVLKFQTVKASDVSENLASAKQLQGHPILFTTKDTVAVLDTKKLFQCSDLIIDLNN